MMGWDGMGAVLSIRQDLVSMDVTGGSNFGHSGRTGMH